MQPIVAERRIAASPQRVFALLRNFDAHWELADRYVTVLSLDGPVGARHGGTLRVRGPLGLRRTLRTRLAAASPGSVSGIARAPGGTLARVEWQLTESRHDRTDVRLAVGVRRASRLDALLLRLGGRRWMRARLGETVDRLAALVET